MANFDDSKITIQIGDATLAAVTKKMQESKEYLKVHTPKPPTEDDFEEYLFNEGVVIGEDILQNLDISHLMRRQYFLSQ